MAEHLYLEVACHVLDLGKVTFLELGIWTFSAVLPLLGFHPKILGF